MNSNPQNSGPILIANELVKAKQIINEFVYSCSHSMRGPLKSISGLVNLLQQSIRTGKEDPQRYLSLISQSVDKMETLLHQLEQFLENSKKDLICEPIAIHTVIDDAVKTLQPEISCNNITLTSHVDQTGDFYSDIHRFKLVLIHLLSNAVIFADMAKDSRVIEVNVTATSASCSIQVFDNGIGIPYEIQHRIFDLFYRGSERSVGAGVGLHIVQQVVSKMGGSISVNSAPWQGANFFVWLPNSL